MNEKELEMLRKAKLKEQILFFFIKLGISLVIGTLFFIGLYFGRTRSLIDAVDGFFIGGATMIGVALLSVVTRFGAFDTFAYAFSTLKVKYIPNTKKTYEDLYDYKEKKTEKRENTKYNFLPYLVAGIVLFLVAFILFLVLQGSR